MDQKKTEWMTKGSKEELNTTQFLFFYQDETTLKGVKSDLRHWRLLNWAPIEKSNLIESESPVM